MNNPSGDALAEQILSGSDPFRSVEMWWHCHWRRIANWLVTWPDIWRKPRWIALAPPQTATWPTCVTNCMCPIVIPPKIHLFLTFRTLNRGHHINTTTDPPILRTTTSTSHFPNNILPTMTRWRRWRHWLREILALVKLFFPFKLPVIHNTTTDSSECCDENVFQRWNSRMYWNVMTVTNRSQHRTHFVSKGRICFPNAVAIWNIIRLGCAQWHCCAVSSG